jgi:hypothetical protein
VQAQKAIERATDKKRRRMRLFETLMATRATRMAPAHVEALNSIPLTFYGNRRGLKEITTAWNDYLAHLSDETKRKANYDAWIGEGIPKFVDVVFYMSAYLGISLSRQDIQNGIYMPEGHTAIEADLHKIRWGFARVFEGKFGFPIYVNNLPPLNPATTESAASNADALHDEGKTKAE